MVRTSLRDDRWPEIEETWVRRHYVQRRSLFSPGDADNGLALSKTGLGRVTHYTIVTGKSGKIEELDYRTRPHAALSDWWIGATVFPNNDKRDPYGHRLDERGRGFVLGRSESSCTLNTSMSWIPKHRRLA